MSGPHSGSPSQRTRFRLPVLFPFWTSVSPPVTRRSRQLERMGGRADGRTSGRSEISAGCQTRHSAPPSLWSITVADRPMRAVRRVPDRCDGLHVRPHTASGFIGRRGLVVGRSSKPWRRAAPAVALGSRLGPCCRLGRLGLRPSALGEGVVVDTHTHTQKKREAKSGRRWQQVGRRRDARSRGVSDRGWRLARHRHSPLPSVSCCSRPRPRLAPFWFEFLGKKQLPSCKLALGAKPSPG